MALKESTARRWWMLGAALACVAIQLSGSLHGAALALGLWLTLLAHVDRPALRRLWLPRFWLLSLLIALASGLLLGPRDGPGLWHVISWRGLEAGALMLLRGALIFALAIWASRALGGKDLQRVARRLGVAPLGSALAAALQLLPELQARLRAARQQGRGPGRGLRQLAVQLIAEAARLADEIAGQRSSPLLAAVVGAPHSGKTTLLAQLTSRLQHEGLRVGGITQPTIHEGAEVRGYRVRCVATGEERPLATRGAEGFVFADVAWSWAHERIRAARQELDVLVVDELGRLEAKGAGHLPALLAPLAHERVRVHLLGVRADCQTALQAQLGPFDLVIAPRSDAVMTEDFTARLVRAVTQDVKDEQSCALPPPPTSEPPCVLTSGAKQSSARARRSSPR